MTFTIDLKSRAMNWVRPSVQEHYHEDITVQRMIEAAVDPAVCYNGLDISDMDASAPPFVR